MTRIFWGKLDFSIDGGDDSVESDYCTLTGLVLLRYLCFLLGTLRDPSTDQKQSEQNLQ